MQEVQAAALEDPPPPTHPRACVGIPGLLRRNPSPPFMSPVARVQCPEALLGEQLSGWLMCWQGSGTWRRSQQQDALKPRRHGQLHATHVIKRAVGHG